MWVVTIASYVLMNRAALSQEQVSSANRWLMQLMGMSGVVLTAAEGLYTLEDVRRVLRVLTWGGAFCGIVAVLQFQARINLAEYLKLPGFSQNSEESVSAEIVSRGSLNRVFGTAIDPIELGVSAGMLLALAVYLMMHDTGRAKWKRVVPVVCIAAAIPVSVSRSGVIAVVAALGVLIVSLPPTRRLKGLAMIPLGLVAVLVAAPGLIGTLASYFLAGTSDPSIAHRTNNYPYVEQLVSRAPWLGQGGGTYIAVEIHVLDNQYLTTAIELGVLGVAALAFYLALPVAVALAARRRTSDPELRDLCAALAGSALAAVLCAATFDGLSFPMFFNLQALIAGLAGAVWMMVERDERRREGSAERMNVLTTIAGMLWRHKRVTIPVVLLTLAGIFYVTEIRVPSYQAEANVLLLSPPAPPTAEQIAQAPALAKANNPYANIGNPLYAADLMTSLVTSPDAQQSLEDAGVSPGYQVTVDTEGTPVSPPALDVTGVGSSPQAAIQGANLVAAAISSDLRQLQESQHVPDQFMITTVQYVASSSATASFTGKTKPAPGLPQTD